MRGEKLRSLLPGWQFCVIDTDIPFVQQNNLFRSLGFRYQIGPVIKAVNNYILHNLPFEHYDLVWIDKGIFITKDTTAALGNKAGKLVHYTPDTAFFGNKSRLFYQSIKHYDYVITTKNFELPNYRALLPGNKIIATTQGFDSDIHKRVTDFSNKQNRVAFVGLCEPSREAIIQRLIDNDIKVALAGYKWDNFLRKNRGNTFLEFKGNSLWNQEYTTLISSSFFSLGLLSKRFPEMHTTRTFEIPACGTALLTEENKETLCFFSDKDVIFYRDADQLIKKIKYYQEHPFELEQLTLNGYNKVILEGYDYHNILERIIKKIL